ncbi:hypothetical protein N181_00975 [Sinorhizobium fredii USDA 205]|uniref:Uncharacterized protein n=1 Tax=Rhizobium fredii TaxID=380 RepID=A0A844ACH5_RHIFR|nr:hypothetical protein [Sinorhizobium fredii]KSV92737.1 hypothetical protein N181_00975 [Sinorhizobium fredii USDA 205]MQX10829.1 hypothetical protein [Sinorhizobium fredii]GEC31475.1 hypothetical protein EFR01_16460 [Sinorhizobium fredii]GLS09179.1 hypothetical protein GCM10007864_28090 [Sinorhizobium fredii]
MESLLPKLRAGNTVRYVSPATTPDRERVFQATEVRESWGFKVELARTLFESTPNEKLVLLERFELGEIG